MCTAVILNRPKHRWPLIIAANRDEMAHRQWLPPGRHWPDRPQIVGGKDKLAGGTWLGINDDGVIATILNRPNSLGPSDNKRSRGELVLEALDHATAYEAAKALIYINPESYSPFNLIIADSQSSFWICNDEKKKIRSVPIQEGFSMITNKDLNDKSCPRIYRHLSRFSVAEPPDFDIENIFSWESLLSDKRKHVEQNSEDTSICIDKSNGYGTLCSAIIGLPEISSSSSPIFLFCQDQPGTIPFYKINLE